MNWLHLYHRFCPDLIYRMLNSNRRSYSYIIRNANSGFRMFQGIDGLRSHIVKTHPQIWFDDEVNALFFLVYDYLTSLGMLVDIEIKNTNDGWYLTEIIITEVTNNNIVRTRDMWFDESPTSELAKHLISVYERHMIK